MPRRDRLPIRIMVLQEKCRNYCKELTKTYSTKTFFINAKTNGGGKLTYSIDDKKVAT